MRFFTFAVFMLSAGILFPQNISVKDSITNLPLINANVQAMNNSHAVITNHYGEFDLGSFSPNDTIKISHLSYSPVILSYKEMSDKKIILLSPASIEQQEVLITDKISKEPTVSSREVIEFDEQLKNAYVNPGDALKSTSSLYIKDFGGFGGAKLVSMRGMSSENTIVLFNEARVNDLAVGSFDLSSISSSSVSRIEVVKNFDEESAWASSGGILKIFTNQKYIGRRITAGTKYSTDKYQAFSAGYSDGNENIFFDLNAERSFSPNHFDYVFKNEQHTRQNSHFNKTYLNANLVLNQKDFYLSLYNNYSYMNSGIPGFVVTNNFNSSNATNKSHKYLTILNSWYYINPVLSLNGLLSYNKQSLELFDPAGFILIESRETKLQDASGVLKLNFETAFLEGNIGNEFNYSFMKDFSVLISADNAPEYIKRTTAKVFINLKAPILSEVPLVDQVNIFTKLNYEITKEIAGVTSTSDYFSYSTGLSLGKDNAVLKLQYGKTYRFPTFNEKYYSSLYNHYDLNREMYTSIDAGIETHFDFSGKTSFTLTVYNIDGKNKIVWVPTRLAIQTPRNIALVNLKGIEAGITKSLFKNIIELSAFYVFTEARNKGSISVNDNSYNKLLRYTPVHRLNSSITANFEPVIIAVYSSFASQSYYTTDNHSSYVLPAYFVADISASYMFDLFNHRHSVSATIYNLFNKEFFVIESYPMPLRSLLLTLNLDIL